MCLMGVGICGWLFDLYELALVFSILQNGSGLLNCVILNSNGEDLENNLTHDKFNFGPWSDCGTQQ